MIYTTDIIGYQWDLFIKSVALGILLGGCYDVLRMVRIILCFGRKTRIATDFIYCVWAGFLSFSFLLNENFGFLRLYVIIGAMAGFSAWYFTIGRITPKAARLIHRILKAILKPFCKIFQKILKTAKNPLQKAKIILFKKSGEAKSLLKKKVKVVYNILCLNVSKAFSFCGGKAGKEPEKLESNGIQKTEKRPFFQDCNYCVRNIYSLFADIDPGGDK